MQGMQRDQENLEVHRVDRGSQFAAGKQLKDIGILPFAP